MNFWHSCSVLILLNATLSVPVSADQSDEAGHGRFFIGYQYIHVDGFEATTGTLPIGTTDTHSINFELEYQFSNGWSIEAGIPWIRKRYTGPVGHNPALINPPQNSKFIDDGEYHTSFQDWHLGVSYLLIDGPFSVEPFAALGVPSQDYPFFAHAAVGQNLTKFDLGVSFSYQPSLSDAFFRLDVSRVFVEETLGVSIDHWRINGEAGYFFTPRFYGRLFVIVKEGDGLDFPDDFPPPRDDFYWYQHDRMVKHNYINAGIGASYAFSERYQLELSGLTMVHADQVHIVDYAFSVGLSYSF